MHQRTGFQPRPATLSRLSSGSTGPINRSSTRRGSFPISRGFTRRSFRYHRRWRCTAAAPVPDLRRAVPGRARCVRPCGPCPTTARRPAMVPPTKPTDSPAGSGKPHRVSGEQSPLVTRTGLPSPSSTSTGSSSSTVGDGSAVVPATATRVGSRHRLIAQRRQRDRSAGPRSAEHRHLNASGPSSP